MVNFLHHLLPRSFQTEEETQLARITLALVLAAAAFCLVIIFAWSLNNLARLYTIVAAFLFLGLPSGLFTADVYASHNSCSLLAYWSFSENLRAHLHQTRIGLDIWH